MEIEEPIVNNPHLSYTFTININDNGVTRTFRTSDANDPELRRLFSMGPLSHSAFSHWGPPPHPQGPQQHRQGPPLFTGVPQMHLFHGSPEELIRRLNADFSGRQAGGMRHAPRVNLRDFFHGDMDRLLA